MAYKRQIDRLPIVPGDAKEFNVVCHYCIVGCGYKAYTWPINKQGGAAPSKNKFGVDLAKQQQAEAAAWYAPSMYNIVRQNGGDVHLVIKPDEDCVVNSGLASIRGARIAEMSYSRTRNTQLQRLTDPMVWRYGQMQPTSWDDALDLVARVTVAVINEMGEDGLFVSAYDHGGAGGGYENTWGTGKLYFGAMKVQNFRLHNRPAYNSEVHASRDMGVDELNNCYEDAELADTLVAIGTNALETQTNYFLNHWLPNLRGSTIEKKNAEFGSEEVEPVRVIIVDPRRTVTVNACEVEAGKDRVMHLAINSGTDLALFNAWFTYIAEEGWIDKAFIAASTKNFDAALAANRMSLEEAAQVTGLTANQIRQSAEWIAKPKAGGVRRHTMFAYEKGLIFGNDNYRTNGALVNLSSRDGKPRPSGRRLRAHGRPSGRLCAAELPGTAASPLRRQASHRGQRRRAPHLGLRSLQDDVERVQIQAGLQEAHRHRKGCDDGRALWRSRTYGEGNHGGDQEGRSLRFRRRHRAVPDRSGLSCLAAGSDVGRDESHLDERRAPHAAHRTLHGSAGPGLARLPDRRAHCQPYGGRAARAGQE